MAHKAYHGKTGRIFNVSRRAVGIVVNKRIKNRILAKRINVRIEHIKHSTSRAGHLAYVSPSSFCVTCVCLRGGWV
jgi:large subunit ribosomal protein L21e